MWSVRFRVQDYGFGAHFIRHAEHGAKKDQLPDARVHRKRRQVRAQRGELLPLLLLLLLLLSVRAPPAAATRAILHRGEHYVQGAERHQLRHRALHCRWRGGLHQPRAHVRDGSRVLQRLDTRKDISLVTSRISSYEKDGLTEHVTQRLAMTQWAWVYLDAERELLERHALHLRRLRRQHDVRVAVRGEEMHGHPRAHAPCPAPPLLGVGPRSTGAPRRHTYKTLVSAKAVGVAQNGNRNIRVSAVEDGEKTNSLLAPCLNSPRQLRST